MRNIWTKVRGSLLLPLLTFASLAAAVGPSPVAGGEVPSSQLPCLLVPQDNADLAPGRTMLIGRSATGGASLVKIEVNGKLASFAAARDGVFLVTINVISGKNVIGIVDGQSHANFTLNARLGGKYRLHPKSEVCEDCHLPEDKGYRISVPAEARCRKCHQGKDAGKFVHGPLGAGRCTACHDPHASSLARLQRSEKGCFGCHEPFTGSGSLHKPVASGRCDACHNPHSSDFVTHLVRSGNDLCVECHKNFHAQHRTIIGGGRQR